MTTKLQTYPKYKDSGVEWLGRIPAGWEVKKLKFVASVQASNVDKKSYEGEKNVLLCNYVDVYKNESVDSTLPFMNATATNKQVIELGLQVNDVLITKDSETPDDIGIPALVEETVKDLVCGYHLYLLRLLGESATGEYLFRFLQSHPVKGYFETHSNGVTRFGLGSYSVKNIFIYIPPSHEQKQIADFLDGKTKVIDELIEKKEKLIALLREKRTALITRAVTKGLDPRAKRKPSGVEWLGRIPAGWEKLPLKFLFSYQSGGVWGDDERQDEHDIICIRVADFDFLRFIAHSSDYTLRNLPKIKEELVLSGASILLEKSGGGDQSPVGRAVRYLEKQRATCSNFVQKLQTNKKYNSDFIVLLFSALYSMGVTKKAIKQTTGIQNLDLGYFMRTDIFLPSSEEQKNIVDYINDKVGSIVGTTEKVEAQIEKLKEYRSSLIYSAVTGEIKI